MNNNKISSMYLPKYVPEQAKIYFHNCIEGVKFNKLVKYPSNELTNAIIEQNYSKALHEVRASLKKTNSGKYAIISYTCDVFSSVTNSWHHIEETRKYCGYYTHVSEILNIIKHVKARNNNDCIKNLTFNVEFIIK